MGHLDISKEHFQIHVWRKILKLWGLGLVYAFGNKEQFILGTLMCRRGSALALLFRWKPWCTACLVLAQILPKTERSEHSLRCAPHTERLPVSGEYEEEFKRRISNPFAFSSSYRGARLVSLPMRKTSHVLQQAGWRKLTVHWYTGKGPFPSL